MSIFNREVETPNRLSDIPDPCTEHYYPRWSSRGMRSVRCTRPAKATLINKIANEHRRVCGVHARTRELDDRFVIER